MADAPALGAVARGCGIIGLAGLKAGSVGLVCADLPSGETRAPFDQPIDLRAFWKAVRRALAPTGNVVLMASSLDYAAILKNSARRWFRYDMVWHKTMATGHYNTGHRPLRDHEFVLVFNRGVGDGAYFAPQMAETGRPIKAWVRRADRGHGANYGVGRADSPSRVGATDRFPRSVLVFPSVGTSARERVHPQQKPLPLLAHFVRTYCPPDGLVVDPCAGSGSCGVAAQRAGRRFMGWDLYFENAGAALAQQEFAHG